MHIWEGVYERFQEVPASGEGHYGQVWGSRSLARARELLRSIEKPGTIPAVPAFGASLLPLLAALVLESSGRVRILDFGGGLGVTYVSVVAGVGDTSKIDYHIIETDTICKIGSELFCEQQSVHFHAALPSLEDVDIVHLGSSLQYIDDWKTLLAGLSGYRAQHFMFTDLCAGDIPSYVTAQNYYDEKIPARFFNIDEVIGVMAENAYTLLFRSRFKGPYLGIVQEMPQENFPDELRLGDTCSLLFRRQESRAGAGQPPSESNSPRMDAQT